MVTAIGNSDGLWNLCANAAANRFCQHSRNTAMTVRDGHRACEAGHSLWMYDAVSSESIFAYKYDGKRAYADFYSQAVPAFLQGLD